MRVNVWLPLIFSSKSNYLLNPLELYSNAYGPEQMFTNKNNFLKKKKVGEETYYNLADGAVYRNWLKHYGIVIFVK